MPIGTPGFAERSNLHLPVAPGHHQSRRMSGVGIGQLAGLAVEHAVPDGEVQAVVLLHLERAVERGSTCGRIAKVDVGQRPRANGVHRGHREQRRFHPVAADVEQEHRQVIVVQPVITEGVATELHRGDEPPVGRDRRPATASAAARTYARPSAARGRAPRRSRCVRAARCSRPNDGGRARRARSGSGSLTM